MLRYLMLLVLMLPINLYAAECQSIQINGSTGWEPISYRNADGELVGIAVEVAKRIFSQLGVNIIIGKDLPWKRQQLRLEKGSLDLINAAYYNDKRSKKFLYSQPYHIEKIAIFVHIDRSFEFKDLHSLKGKVGLRPLGGTYGNDFDQFATDNLNIAEFSDNESSLKRIDQGKEDYLVLALMDGLFSAHKHGYSSSIIPLTKNVAQLPIYFLMSKKSPCAHLIKKINSRLKELKSSNFIKNLEEKYLLKLGYI